MSAAESRSVYEDNITLLSIAQSSDESEAMRATEELLELNRGLLRSIALRFRERGVDMEDLIQIGTIGMIKAIRSFDLERGTAFSTYAVPLIFGEIRRHMRDEGPIKVSRYYKKLGASLVNERNKILSLEGREAHIDELASAFGVSASEAAVALEAISPIVSLSDRAFGDDDDGAEIGSLIADADSDAEFERIRDRIALNEAISQMPQMSRKIILLRYYRNMTQQETADELGLSQVKVSREEKKIMDFLRSKMI